ncbi:hypothetical protein MTX20_34540 [Bradyrhizobium sp. ISRA435]|nr:hypothetical protein MTX20_34540 [Bradyrhizobium sp. ISRA435]
MAVLSEDRAQSTRDLTALRARHDALASALLEAQIAVRAFKNTRVSLAPEVTPQPVGARRLSLLFIAAVASILIAFGAIAFYIASSSRGFDGSAGDGLADNQSLRR